MKLQTLKELIEIQYNRCETISEFKTQVLHLLEMYDKDTPVLPIPLKSDSLEEKIKQLE